MWQVVHFACWVLGGAFRRKRAAPAIANKSDSATEWVSAVRTDGRTATDARRALCFAFEYFSALNSRAVSPFIIYEPASIIHRSPNSHFYKARAAQLKSKLTQGWRENRERIAASLAFKLSTFVASFLPPWRWLLPYFFSKAHPTLRTPSSGFYMAKHNTCQSNRNQKSLIQKFQHFLCKLWSISKMVFIEWHAILYAYR